MFILYEEQSIKAFLALGQVIRSPQELIHWMEKLGNFLATLDSEEKWLDFLAQLDKLIEIREDDENNG